MVKLKHYYQAIPGWFDFQDIYERAVKEASAGALFIEVGNFLGRSLAFLGTEIVNSDKRIQLISIDHLEIFRIPEGCTEPEHQKAHMWQGFYLRDILTRNMRPCFEATRKLCYVHWERSSDNASGFGSDEVDFVFLDACHDYDGITRELKAWWPTVAVGGVLGGHDYSIDFPGVVQAV